MFFDRPIDELNNQKKVTCVLVVVIREPPADPPTKMASPYSSKTIIGHIEESGRLPGLMKLAGDGSRSKPFDIPGVEKSSI